MLLLDDTGYAAAEQNLTGLFGLARQKGWVTKEYLDRYTFTIAGVYSLGTGDQPTLLQIKDEFAGEAVDIDSIFASVQRSGGKTEAAGENLWKDLFGAHLNSTFTSRDLGPYVGENTVPMLAHLTESLTKGDSRLTVVHLQETGHVNHRFGIHGAPLVALLRDLDRKIVTLVNEHSSDTTWLIGSDHGTTVEGQHGGESAAERTAFLAAFGPGIAQREVQRISQVDVPNILAVLTGAPLPTQGCGLLPDVFAPGTEAVLAQARTELLLQKRALYRGLTERYGQASGVDDSSVIDLKRAIDRIKLGAGAFRDVMGPLLVTFGLFLVFAFLTFRRRLVLTTSISWFVLGFVVPAVFFFLYPSQVYLKMSATARYLCLGPFFASIGIAFVASPFVAIRLNPTSQVRLRALLWGVASGLLVSTEMRYSLTFAPIGLLILASLGPVSAAQDRRAILLAYLGSLGCALMIGPLPYAFLSGVDLSLLTALRSAFRKNDLFTEGLLLLALGGAAVFVNRYYRGRMSQLQRAMGWIAVGMAHLGYHLRLAPNNLALVVLLLGCLVVIGFGLSRDIEQGRPYWLFLIGLLVSTQQQVALHLVLCLLGAVFVRWLITKNPYPTTDLRHAGYFAALGICYLFTFLATKGHLIAPSHFEQLTGFVGYKMPLYLPLSVALVCFYYFQPLLIAWLFALATLPKPPNFAPVGQLMVLFSMGEALFAAVLLSVSTVPGDTYQKSLAGALITLNITCGCILALACFGSADWRMLGATSEVRPVQRRPKDDPSGDECQELSENA